MCGRCCLTLSPCQIQEACKYDSSEQKMDNTPEWRSEYNFGKKYEPSYNIAPTDMIPVLISADHFEDSKKNDKALAKQKKCEKCIVSMLWGMIPFWHKGDYKKHGLTTNNCRLEHMLESKLYSGPFKRGQRCVILCEGFYEWQTTKSAKPSERAAYYIYMPQKCDIKVYDKSTWNQENFKFNLLKLAGLFDTWKDENGDIIYSFSVITFESDKLLTWLHHRTPAILETKQQVDDWLDFKRIPHKEALKILKHPNILLWHRVSNLVNNTRNKQIDCNKPLSDSKQNKKNNLLKSWLTVRKRKEEELKKETSSDTDEFNHSDIDNEDEFLKNTIKKKKLN